MATLNLGQKTIMRDCLNELSKPAQVCYLVTTSTVAVGITDFTPHDGRHTAASRWVMAGVPLAAVAGYLGHSTIRMTMRYAHLQAENKDRAIAAMMSVYATPPSTKARARKKSE